MRLFWMVVSFIFGGIAGSFLNVCIYRLPREKSIVKPTRSYCPHCHEPIAWYDNIPLVSYFLLHAQCRQCGSPISARYPAVEAVTAALFAATYWLMSAPGREEHGSVILIYMVITGGLIAGSFMDLEFRIIPNSITVGGMLIAPVLSVASPWLHDKPEFCRTFMFFGPGATVMGPLGACVLGMAVGAFLTWSAGAMGKLIFRKEAMGMGDVKFMAALGGLLGWQQIVMVFFIGAIVGAVVGIVHILRTKEHHIPFGPFLSVGALITMHAGNRIFDLLMQVSPLAPR